MATTSKAMAQKIKVPASYICSITGEIMADPVFAADGHTYEREAIEEWLKSHDTSPKTNLKLKNKELIENHGTRGDILDFLQDHPELYEKDEVYLSKSLVSELVKALKSNKLKEVQEYLTKDRRLLTRKLEGDYTAFHLAAQFGSQELSTTILESLIKREALSKISATVAGFKPIHLNSLLEQFLTEVTEDDFSFLINKLLQLLKLGAQLNQVEENSQNTLLHKLAIQGKSTALQWLLDKGLSIESRNREGNTPLLLAVLHGQVKATELLMKAGANPQTKNNQNQTAVSIALEKQNPALLKLLVGADKAALPPLHLAIALNDLAAIKTLLKSGQTDLQKLDSTGQTALYALLAGKEIKEKEEIASLLLAAGADPNIACGTEKLTVLHLAVKQGDVALLKFLLKTKAVAAIDAEDINGNTPLHLAASAGQNELAACLLKAGADSGATNQEEQTPVAIAKSQNHSKTAKFIAQTTRALEQAKFEEMGQLRQLIQSQTVQIEQQASRIERLEKENELIKKEVDALKQKMGLAEEKERKEKEEQRGHAAPFLPQYQAKSKPAPKVTAEEVQKFLNYVVAGAQPEAEAMLKQNSDLALASGTVTDHAKRTFENITGFQYAVWALDWHMWRMIKGYLSKEEAIEQSKGFGEGSWIAKHGEHAEWKKLLEAQQTLIDNYSSWTGQQVNAHWVKQVGGAQLLLPMHVLQEYNHPTRPLHPCPKFTTEETLPRTQPAWVTRLGTEVAGVRGEKTRGGLDTYEAVVISLNQYTPRSHYPKLSLQAHPRTILTYDGTSLAALFSTRTQQREALVAELVKDRGPRPSQ